MPLLVTQPYYAAPRSKLGLVAGGISGNNASLPLSSMVKFEFDTDVVRALATKLNTSKVNLSGVGFITQAVFAGGSNYEVPLDTTDIVNYSTEAVTVGSSLAIARDKMASASNSRVGLFLGGSAGNKLSLIEEYSQVDGSVSARAFLASPRSKAAAASNYYECLITGDSTLVESYLFEDRTIRSKFNLSQAYKSQAASSSTDIAVFSGGELLSPTAYQFKIRYIDNVEIPTTNLSAYRSGLFSLSTNSLAVIGGGSVSNTSIEKFNFIDNTIYSNTSLPGTRLNSGYASNCHGGTIS